MALRACAQEAAYLFVLTNIRTARSCSEYSCLVLLSRCALVPCGPGREYEPEGGTSPLYRRGDPMEETAAARVLREQLDRWAAAGIIDADQASRIEAAEQAREQALPRRRLPLVAEVLGYLGAVFAIPAVGVTLHQLWENVPPPAELAVARGISTRPPGAG